MKYLNVVMKELVYGSSLLLRRELRDVNEFNMHRLVRMFMVLEMKAEHSVWMRLVTQAAFCLDAAVARFGHDQILSDLPQYFLHYFRIHLPHTLAVLKHVDFDLPSIESLILKLVTIQQFTGNALRYTGRRSEALVAYTKQLEILKSNPECAKWNEYIVSTLNNLAQVLIKLNRIDEAEQKVHEVISQTKKIHEAEVVTKDMLTTYICLGLVQMVLGHLYKAESTWKKCMSMDDELFQGCITTSLKAPILGNIASVYHDLGKFKDAERM